MQLRFNRDYILKVQFGSKVAEYVPPVRIAFECQKSINGQLNKIKLQIYNLTEANRRFLVKDPEEDKQVPFSLDVGYDGKVENIFKGTVFKAYSERKGSDFITTLESIDGGYDMVNSFTSKVVKGKTTAVDELIGDFTRVTKGKITEQNQLIRPKVMIGNTITLIQESLNEGESFFIDGEKAYIIKADDVVESFIPVVNAKTGLLNQPQRANQIVTFDTLLNPAVKIGCRVDLQSETAPHLTGIYKVETITYKGDWEGSDWYQSCDCILISRANVL
jgi:co-chaperonin GroES (HSP10)